MTLPSIVDAATDYSPDTVKSRARAALVLAVSRITDKLTDTANELTLNELSQATSSLGRISGIGDEQRDATVTVVVTRDAPIAMPSNELPASPSRIALAAPHATVSREVEDANAMRDNALNADVRVTREGVSE